MFSILHMLAVVVLGSIGYGSCAPLPPGPEYKRLNNTNAALLVIDHQVGLFQLARDFEPNQFKLNIFAHAAIGQLFGLPVVLTTSAETGPNGPLPREIREIYPNAPLIQRQGEVDAWDNVDFRNAVIATGKTQFIIAGITTDVCATFLALSLRQAGYDIWVNTDASGTFDERTAADAKMRMNNAGVQVVSNFAIVSELVRDWRNTPGASTVLPYFDEYLASYGFLARAHKAAVLNGTLFPGEAAL